jgi:hypothetical protein
VVRALQDKPAKWEVILERGTVEQVAGMADALWTSQLDRHGTPDESVPLHASQAEADAAVYLAITLVRVLTSGAIHRVWPPPG